MSQIIKVIEILAESEESWEDAAARAVERAEQTLRNVRSIYIKEMTAAVENGQIVSYRIDAKVSFALD